MPQLLNNQLNNFEQKLNESAVDGPITVSRGSPDGGSSGVSRGSSDGGSEKGGSKASRRQAHRASPVAATNVTSPSVA